MSIIKSVDVKKWYGDFQALKGISMDVAEGEVLVIAGPSGSGKSTFIRCINRLEQHQDGQIFVDGIELTNDLKNIEAIRSEVGMVFQSFNLFPHLTVLQNITLAPIWVRKKSKTEAEEKAMELLERVGIPEQADKFPGQLSGGQQQRVAVARAIVLKPKVLLFDEPLSNLDAKLRRQVREDIREIQQKLGVTTIYVTHDQEEALAISDKVIVMNKAVIAQEGSPKDLYNFPENKFVANFIGDANDVTAEIINKQSNTYDLKLAEMNVKIEINKNLNDKVSLALRPEKIKINRTDNENCIHASIKSASFVGSSYQYILSSKIGELYVVSGDTTDIFKVGEEVFLSIDEKDIKILND